MTENGDIVAVNDTIIAQFNTKQIQKKIETKYNLTLLKIFDRNLHLYRVQSTDSALDTANAISEESGVLFCHPDFQISKKTQALSSDAYAYALWYAKDYSSYKADINLESAWQITKGAGIKVAVYDEGIDINHKDLSNNIFAFNNFNDTGTNLPYNDDDPGHGTACAGLISAEENTYGGVGIAPQASLYAIRFSDYNVSQDIEAYLWMMDQGVDVISNSWSTGLQLDAYNAIFKKLAKEGRSGKGTIILFASGNDALNQDSAHIDHESESPYVLSIAASTSYNTIAAYSNYGSAIDFTAPGGSSDGRKIFTTDFSSSRGFTTGDYNSNFIGTSAAAPIAAGVVTLMLSANNHLRREDVVTILKYTAQKQGRYTYDQNGRNDHWGYGKIDAGKAVALAKTYGNSMQKSFTQSIFQDIFNQ